MSQGPTWRNNPFNRSSMSPSPAPAKADSRPKSMMATSSPGLLTAGHSRSQSSSLLSSTFAPSRTNRERSSSNRSSMSTSSTFAPSFIHTSDVPREENCVRHIEGENDFSGKRYVWLRDPQLAFVKGWVVEELDDGQLLIQCDDGSVNLSSDCFGSMLM